MRWQAPFFEDLELGMRARSAPAVTLTDGLAAVHRAIVGDRLGLSLDAELAKRVLGTQTPLAHPALVWDVAIGQSTPLTQRVIANLFYRGLRLRRLPLIGDTLASSVEVVALRQTSARAGRPPSGLAVLRIRTLDQRDRLVLDFWRCAMLPLRDAGLHSGREDSLERFPAELPEGELAEAVAEWDLEALAQSTLAAGNDRDPHAGVGCASGDRAGVGRRALSAGARFELHGGDLVSGAPELARLTLNVAAVHHDEHAGGGRRLVYGGHTIGIAAAQATRMLPEIATFLAWRSCDHLAPVYEGDTLHSEIELERLDPLLRAGSLAHLRSRVHALRRRKEGADATAGASERIEVLDWRFVALVM